MDEGWRLSADFMAGSSKKGAFVDPYLMSLFQIVTLMVLER